MLSERISQPKEMTFWGLQEYHLSYCIPSLSLTHTHTHTPHGNDWLIWLQKANRFAFSCILCATIQAHRADESHTLVELTPLLSSFSLAAFCFSHSPAPESMSSESHLHKNSHFSLCFQKPRPMSFPFWSYGSLAEYIDDQLAPWTPELE